MSINIRVDAEVYKALLDIKHEIESRDQSLATMNDAVVVALIRAGLWEDYGAVVAG